MLVDEKVSRFESGFGVEPNNIGLAHNWHTPFHAQNIEGGGPDFSNESDFGYGLSGLGDDESSGGILDSLHTVLDVSNLLLWPAVIYGAYSVFQAMTKSEPAKRRKKAISEASQKLREAKQMSRWSFSD